MNIKIITYIFMINEKTNNYNILFSLNNKDRNNKKIFILFISF